MGLANQISYALNVAEARALLAEEWRGVTNPYDGRPVREEDSPGNYILRKQDGELVYVYYDARGAEFAGPTITR